MIKLLHGDCYELIKDIPDKTIDLVYIDIPYLSKSMNSKNGNIKVKFNKSSDYRNETRTKTFIEISKLMVGIDYSIFDELCRVLKNINIFIWCSKEQLLDIMKYFIENKKCLFELLCWCKTNPAPFTNNTWLTDIEYCLYFRNNKVKLNNKFEYKSKYYISGTNVKDKDDFKHPTIKPIDLVKRHILHVTNDGDLVLDCFMGSGTTGVACKETGRDFIGIEINDEYFKIAEDRLKGITYQGQTSIFTDFEQLESELK